MSASAALGSLQNGSSAELQQSAISGDEEADAADEIAEEAGNRDGKIYLTKTQVQSAALGQPTPHRVAKVAKRPLSCVRACARIRSVMEVSPLSPLPVPVAV